MGENRFRFSKEGWPIFNGVPRDPEDCEYSDEHDRYFYRENISITDDEACDVYWQDRPAAAAPSA